MLRVHSCSFLAVLSFDLAKNPGVPIRFFGISSKESSRLRAQKSGRAVVFCFLHLDLFWISCFTAENAMKHCVLTAFAAWVTLAASPRRSGRAAECAGLENR